MSGLLLPLAAIFFAPLSNQVLGANLVPMYPLERSVIFPSKVVFKPRKFIASTYASRGGPPL